MSINSMSDISRRILYFTINGWAATAPGCNIVEGSTSYVGGVLRGEISTNYLVDPDTGWDNTGGIVRLYRIDGVGAEYGLWVLRDITIGEETTTFELTHHFGSETVPSAGDWVFQLEDPYKLSTTIPEWVTGASARRRWAPVLTTSSITLGQKINLKGGIASVDGITLSGVYDSDYQGFTDNEKFWPLLAKLFSREARQLSGEGPEFFVNLLKTDLDAEDFSTNPLREKVISPFYEIEGIFEGIGTEQGPIFIDTEAFVVISNEGVPPLETNNTLRSWNGTDNMRHGRASVIYDGLPFAIGSTCNVWTLMDSTETSAERTYRGLVENITLSNGLTSFGIQISSLLYSPNIALRRSRGSDEIIRSRTVVKKGGQTFVRSNFSRDSTEFPLLDIGAELLGARPVIIPGSRPDGDIRAEDLASDRVAVFSSNFVGFQQTTDVYTWVKLGPFLVRVYGVDYADQLRRFGVSKPDLYSYIYIIPCDEYPVLGDLETNTGEDVGWISPNRTVEINPPSYDRSATGISPFFPRLITTRSSGLYPNDPPVPQEAEPEWYLVDLLTDTTDYDDYYAAITTDRAMRFETSESRRQNIALGLADILNTGDLAFAHLFEPSGGLISPVGNTYDGPEQFLRNQWKAVHPADVLLQVLCSTGHGFNGPFDTAPSVFGLGIEEQMIDVESFREFAKRNSGLRMFNAHMTAVTDLDPSKFLVDNILKPFFLCLAQRADGRITLVDLNQTRYNPATDPFSNDVFARSYDDGLTQVTASSRITAEDLVDSVSYKLKTYFADSITSSTLNRTITVQGFLANVDSSLGLQTAQTRVFTRVQTSPLVFEPKNATYSALINTINIDTLPPEIAAPDNALLARANDYLRNYRRVVARFTFIGLLDRENPLEIGENLILSLGDFPSSDGRLNGEDSICKIIDAKINYEQDLVTYTALVFDRASRSREIVWNLTAEVTAVDGNEITVADDTFTQYGTGGINGEFSFDYDQFNEGDVIRVFNKSFGDKILTPVIVSKVDGVWELDDATGIVVGDLLMLESKETSLSAYSDFMVWFDDSLTPLT